MEARSLLSIENLNVTAGGKPVVEELTLGIGAGEMVGLVGESGCGKSTLGRTFPRLAKPSAGRILFEGRDIITLSRRAMKPIRRDMQVIFQDPFGALNPRHSVGAIVEEPLKVHGIGTRDERALALEPKLVVADEGVSALDVSIQSQILNIVAELRKRLGLAIVFISHDLSVIRHVSDRIAVMYLGRIVEIGACEAIMAAPRHPYTQALLAAVPRAARMPIRGEIPDPTDPPAGCAFHGRCPHAMERCRTERPELTVRSSQDGARFETACHLYGAV